MSEAFFRFPILSNVIHWNNVTPGQVLAVLNEQERLNYCKWPWCEIDWDFFEILFTLANTDKSLLITQRGVVFKSLPHLPGAIELRIDK